MCNCIFCLTSGGAQCCAIWSAMSVLFLVFAGGVMSNPPVFIKDMSAEQAKTGSHNAFVGAGMYAATTFLAIFMYLHRSKQERKSLGKATKPAEVGLGEDTSDAFSVPLVNSNNSAGGATSASVASGSEQRSSKKKKKSTRNEGGAVTSI